MQKIHDIPESLKKAQELIDSIDKTMPAFIKKYLNSPLYKQIKNIESINSNYFHKILDNPLYEHIKSIQKLSIDSQLRVLSHSNIFKKVKEFETNDEIKSEIEQISQNIDKIIVENNLQNKKLTDEEVINVSSLNNDIENLENKKSKNSSDYLKTVRDFLIGLLSGISITINVPDNSSEIKQSAVYVENQIINNQVFNGPVNQVYGFKKDK